MNAHLKTVMKMTFFLIRIQYFGESMDQIFPPESLYHTTFGMIS